MFGIFDREVFEEMKVIVRLPERVKALEELVETDRDILIAIADHLGLRFAIPNEEVPRRLIAKKDESAEPEAKLIWFKLPN